MKNELSNNYEGVPVEILVLDSGEFPKIEDLSIYADSVRKWLSLCGSLLDGLHTCWHILPSFRIALFAIGKEYFICKSQPVYLGKDGKRSSEPFVGGLRINEVSIEPIKDRWMQCAISLYITRYAKCRTELFELSHQRTELLVNLLKTTNV